MRIIRIEAVTAQMKFDLSRITVAAGEEVVIEFVNRDEMPHNFLVTKEGALETVGLAAEAMVSSPDAFGKSFIPKTPEVLFAIRLLQPGETLQARFTAPTQAGSYPFVCTFPGHWRTMNGIVQVVRDARAGIAAVRTMKAYGLGLRAHWDGRQDSGLRTQVTQGVQRRHVGDGRRRGWR